MASFYFLKTFVILFFVTASLKGQYVRKIQTPCDDDDPTVFKYEPEDFQEENQPPGNHEKLVEFYDPKVLPGNPGYNLASLSKRGNTISLIDVLDFVTNPKSKSKTQGGTQNIFVPRRPARNIKWKSVYV